MKFKFILIAFWLIIGCGKVDCNKLAEIYRKTECKIVVEKMPISSSRHNFYIEGKSVVSKDKDTIFDEENRWFCEYYQYIDKGDTIIKQKDSNLFLIIKKDTILKLNFECGEKKYK